jgi:hypothetical protein
MSISNYANLKMAVATWLNRADLDSYIPDFIRLGEQRIFYGGSEAMPSLPLRVPAMQARATGQIANNEIAFPERFLEPIRIAGSSGGFNWSLHYASPDSFAEQSSSAGLPTIYTLLNNSIQTAGSGAANYTMDYYQALASLTADSDTNWVLQNAPGVYLYAALIESAPFIGDSALVTQWHSMFSSAVNSINRATKYHAAGALVARVVK